MAEDQLHKFVLEIPEDDPLPSEKSTKIIQTILTNETLIKIMEPLEENSEMISDLVQTWQASI